MEFVGVNRVYGQVVALDDCYFRLMPGELSFLVGPSGAGKTTLLRLINREIRPSRGEVWVDGLPAHDLPAKRLAELRPTPTGSRREGATNDCRRGRVEKAC